nr:peptidoglycan DD-metalloendopeptidase family protein [Prevotella sp.]
AHQDQKLSDIMNKDAPSVHVETDKEEVANVIRRYDLNAVAVLNDDECLTGIVTVDDAVDVLAAEANEDIEKMNAIAPMEDSFLETHPWRMAKKCLPWICILLFLDTFSTIVVDQLQYKFEIYKILIAFIPAIMDTAGNAGGQTIAIVGEKNGRAYCHFSIMVNGGRINPETILEIRSHKLVKQIVICTKSGSHVNVTTSKKGDEEQRDKDSYNKKEYKKEQRAIASRNQRTNVSNRQATSLGPDDEITFGSSTFQINLSDIEKEHWAYPLPGSHVISPYGGARHHAGVDIKTKPNDKILAAFDGVVTRSGPYFGYGNCIVIRHAYGFETLYSHQSRNFVKAGTHVKAGDVIGLTGRTGRATTEHLHFEIHYKGSRLNPGIIFDHKNKSLQQVTLTLNTKGGIKSQRNYYAQGR